jgi:hypothetical protein
MRLTFQICRTLLIPLFVVPPRRLAGMTFHARRKRAYAMITLTTLLVGALVSPPAMSAETRIALETGRIVGGQPVGLFGKVLVTAYGSNKVDTRTWLFLPGNRVSRVYPYGGTGLFDPSRCSGDTCGSYQIKGAQLTVRWDGGRVDSWSFVTSAEGIRLDGDLYRPARAMSAASLAGRWTDGGGRGVIGSNIYTFDGNGRFSFGTSQRALPGTYRVQGLTLTLNFADGDMRRRTLFALSAGEPVGMISVESEVYARNK